MSAINMAGFGSRVPWKEDPAGHDMTFQRALHIVSSEDDTFIKLVTPNWAMGLTVNSGYQNRLCRARGQSNTSRYGVIHTERGDYNHFEGYEEGSSSKADD